MKNAIWIALASVLGILILTESVAEAEDKSSSYPPSIIINNNYSSSPTPAQPTPVPPAVATPKPDPTPSEVCAEFLESPPARPLPADNGFGLALNIGSSTLSSPDLGLNLDFRFWDYLGLEARSLHSFSGERDLLFGFFKVQIPFKSRLIDFTPSAGIGYGLESVRAGTFTGTQYFLGSQFEFFHFLIVKGEYGQGVDGTMQAKGEIFEGGPAPPLRTKYEHASVGAGLRVSPHVVMGVQYEKSTVGSATVNQTLFQIGFQL